MERRPDSNLLDRLNLLVVEADQAYARRLADGFTAAGSHVTIAATLDEASARAATVEFDVAVVGPDLCTSDAVRAATRRALPTLPLVEADGPTARDQQAAGVLENLADAVFSFALRPQGPRLVAVNRAVENLLGETRRALLADPDRLWGHLEPDDAARLRQAMDADALLIGDDLRFVLRWYDRDGASVSAEGALSVRRDPRGRIAGADLVVRDQRERAAMEEALRQSEAQYRALADRVTDAVFRLRVWPRPTFEYANPASAEVLGVPAEELRRDASRMFGVARADDLPLLERALQEAAAGPTTVRYGIVTPTGVRTVELSLTPLRDDVESGLVLLGVARDVSERTEIEQTLRGALQRREAEAEEQEPEPAIREGDVSQVVVEAVAATDLGGRSVTVHREPVTIVHDAEAVRRAVTVLLENVRRHTPAGTRAHVTVAEAVGGALITVTDDGPGFPWPEGSPEAIKGSAEITAASGYAEDGLGGVAAVATLHRGRTWIQSRPGSGTSVRLLVRAAELPTATDAPATDAPAGASIPADAARTTRIGHTAS